MQLYGDPTPLSVLRALTARKRCPRCGNAMVAPASSEFVEGGEIRHHWECDECGEPSSTSIVLTGE